jgi:hypothetical protein
VSHSTDKGSIVSSLGNLMAAGAGDLESSKQAVTLVVLVLNSVDCSSAPNCLDLNRAACGATLENTCGACLSGYVGTAQGNDVCLEPGADPVEQSCIFNCFGRGTCVNLDVNSGLPYSDSLGNHVYLVSRYFITTLQR